MVLYTESTERGYDNENTNYNVNRYTDVNHHAKPSFCGHQ